LILPTVFAILKGHKILETRAKLRIQDKEPFDYTKWQENLYEDMTIEELSGKAMENRRTKQ